MNIPSLISSKCVVRICAAVLILPALLFAAGCERERALEEPPPVPPKEVQTTDPIHFPETPEGVAVVNHINAVYSVGPDAEANYQASLNVLRSKMKETVNILSTAYNESDKRFYGDRWVLVQTLADLRGTEALDSLTKIANEELPERTTLYDHEISPYEEETVIKITALRGLANLSIQDDNAAKTLATFFNHKDANIRLQAMNLLAQAIREANEERRRTLLQLLPKDYVFVPDLSNIQPTGIAGGDANQRPTGKGKGPAPSTQR